MRKLIVVFVGALSLVACSKDKPAEDVTTTRGATSATEQMAQPVSAEEIRTMLLTKRPSASDSINSMIITNDNGVITLRGNIEDEATHADIVNRVRAMPNVRSVRDELQVMPRSSMGTGMGTGSGMGSDQSGSQMGGSQMGGQGQTGGQMGGSQGQTGSQMGGSQGQTGSQMGGSQGQTGSQMGGSQGGGNTQGSMGQTRSGSTGGTTGAGATTKSESVRQAMQTARPKSSTVIEALTITDDGTMVTIAGMVPDETTHQALVKAAKDTAGANNVKDQMKVAPKKKTTP